MAVSNKGGTDMDYVLSTENLSKQYKNFKALNRLSMHVEKGAIYGFIGKNGAGKTTLIRLIDPRYYSQRQGRD